jgi:Co/Zn/Cd efflux system component
VTARSIALFVAAALAEIGGAYLVWVSVKDHRRAAPPAVGQRVHHHRGARRRGDGVSQATLPMAAAGAPHLDWLRAARRARALSWLSLVWMGAEGAIAITAGILAGSIALIGFGIDSAIEGVASLVIVWRFTGHRLWSDAAEQRAQKLVAIQFFLLAPFVTIEALRHLVNGAHVETSWLGMALTASSLIGMPILGAAKQRLAVTLGSSATHGEGAQNLLCAYLAGAVLLGLAGNALLGWWWLDPIAALVIAAVAVREGRETWRGEGCCAAGPSLVAGDGEVAGDEECCT